MRTAIEHQLPLTPAPIAHHLGQELAAIGRRLDRLDKGLCGAALVDLGGGSGVGRHGMSAEQVLRALILRQTMQWSFDELAFHLHDSATARAFCRIGLGAMPPSVGTLKRNIKCITEETLKQVNAALVQQAVADGIETGRSVRGDSTVMETNIHAPTDSTLMWDVLRRLTKLLRQGRALGCGIPFADHQRAAKKKICEIANAEGIDTKRPIYRSLYKLTQATIEAAEKAALHLRKHVSRSHIGKRRVTLADALEKFIALGYRILRQTRIRVFQKGAVASAEKIVSIVEPHTDIIMKGQRQPQYGHKVFLASAKSGIILDCHVGAGNVPDSSEAIPTIERVKAALGRMPHEVSFDGGYAARDNVTMLKALGVQEVAFHKKCGIKVEDMVSSPTIYQRLRRFRAAIEATIGWLKRSFGLRRCRQSGRESFHAHAQAAVVAANLLLLARFDLS